MSEFILVAEDQEVEQMMVERAFQRFPRELPHHIVSDGVEVLSYMKGEGRYSDRVKFPRPTFILLDLMMPRMTAFDVLEWAKKNPACAIIPTVVWSSSDSPHDVKKAYQLGASAYLVKPPEFNDTNNLLQLTFKFWSAVSKPPVPSQ